MRLRLETAGNTGRDRSLPGIWFQAVRFHFVPPSFIPAVLCSVIAWFRFEAFDFLAFLLVMAGVTVHHFGLNMLDDVFDYLHFVDRSGAAEKNPYTGGSGVLTEGLLTVREMLVASVICFLVTAVIGFYLAYMKGWPVLVFGFIGMFSSIFYTVPPIKFGYRGFGELMMVINFGPVIGLGSYYVQSGRLDLEPPKEKVPVPDTKRERKRKKSGNKPEQPKSYANAAFSLLLIGTTILALMFAYTSVNYSYSNAVANPIRMNSDWRESLEWLGSNTPDTGVDYLAVYDQKTYRYPDQAYGVMSWWDYGHMITFIAKRIPNANPFQHGVAGDVGAASFFMTTSEEAANSMADQLGTRYVITDIEMDSGKFWAMATWFNTSAGIQPYQTRFAAPDPAQPDRYQEIILNNPSYYLTMVSRLHNFDGSMTGTEKAYYVEYVDPSISRISIPVITNALVMNASESLVRAAQYNLKAPAGYHAATYSPAIYLPVEPVPALRHYRLVHESPTNVFAAETPDIKYVKVFEYVKGARIRGEGIIEVPLESNTGRQFTYRQQSTNGEFIVPYSTNGSPYGVKAVGKYRIAHTSLVFDVPENAVVQGLTIN